MTQAEQKLSLCEEMRQIIQEWTSCANNKARMKSEKSAEKSKVKKRSKIYNIPPIDPELIPLSWRCTCRDC